MIDFKWRKMGGAFSQFLQSCQDILQQVLVLDDILSIDHVEEGK